MSRTTARDAMINRKAARNPLAAARIATFAVLCAVLAGPFVSGPFVALPRVAAAQSPTFSAEQLRHFEQRVRPLLARRCGECHGAAKQESGLRLDSRDAVLRGADSGPVVLLGKPAASPLIAAVRRTGAIQMPPDGALAPADIQALETWIESGAPWTPGEPAAGDDTVARRIKSSMVKPFRMAGTLPVTAQSPRAIRKPARRRRSRTLCQSSSLLTAPSTMARSMAGGSSLASTYGEATTSIREAISISRSSMSRNDMWQPEQPSSHMVARVGLGDVSPVIHQPRA